MSSSYSRPPRSAMTPLRVRAFLQTPVISDLYLPIDSVLWYHAMRAEYGVQIVTSPGSDHEVCTPGVSLPIARCEEHGPLWYYAASFAQWAGSGIAMGQDHWSSRFDHSLVDLIDWRGKKARVEVSSGPLKSYRVPVYYIHALSIDWHLLALRSWVEWILPFVTHLGKKGAQGWGAVLRWDIEPWHADWSVRDDAGNLMRAIPSSDGKGQFAGFRPSYWMPKNQAICECPSDLRVCQFPLEEVRA